MQLKTDFSDGDVFYSGTTADDDKLNGITNEVNRKGVIRMKTFYDATEKTVSSVPSLEYDFDLTAPVGSLILNVFFSAQLNTSGQMVCLQFSGTNLGTKYLTTNMWRNGSSSSYFQNPEFSSGVGENFLITNQSSGYVMLSRSCPCNLELLDATTNIKVRVANAIGKIKTVTVTIVYIENFEEDA